MLSWEITLRARRKSVCMAYYTKTSEVCLIFDSNYITWYLFIDNIQYDAVTDIA